MTSLPLTRALVLQDPVNEALIFIDTPWLGGNHDGYPLVPFHGYTKLRPRPAGDTSSCSHAALLQSHLTFGLLEAILEVKIPEHILLLTDEKTQERKLTSKNVPELLRDWRYRIRQLRNSEACYQWAKRVQIALKQARGLIMLETLPRFSVLRSTELTPLEQEQILLQIASLAEALHISVLAFPASAPRAERSWKFILRLTKQVRLNMVAVGWCPFTIAILSEEVCTLGYASTCRPLMREGHERCTPKGCVKNTLDVSTYTARHSNSGCNCVRHKPQLEDVVGLLQVGKIPVMAYSSSFGSDSLVINDSAKVDYIAISHVWADGLGSTTEDGLPLCQIRRIGMMVQGLVPTGAFWIDSLCVPSRNDMRKKAIGLMAQTYKRAAAVLVIDSGLCSLPLSLLREEKLLRVLSSDWMQRLWTLQEGLLARKLIFQFADGMLTLEDLLPVGEEHFNTVAASLASEVFRLKKHRNLAISLSDVVKCLRWRITSRTSDETLAIAGLLGVDAFELASLPSEQRMPTFLLRMQNIPADIIFLSGTKLQQPGFQWAPITFMRNNPTSLRFSGENAVCTATGLLADYAATYFIDTTIGSEEEWFIRDLTKQRNYRVNDVSQDATTGELGRLARYTCNVLLMMTSPRPSETIVCAAVFIDRNAPQESEDRMICQFIRRLFLTDITDTEDELDREKVKTLVTSKSGRMKVKVV